MIRTPLCVLVIGLALASATPAVAYWTAGGTGAAFGLSDTVSQGSQPTVTVSGRTATVTWTQTIFHGLPLGGYVNGGYTIRRYPTAGGAGVAAGGGCASTIRGGSATLSCSEQSVPAGSWQYAVTPVLGSWTGAESLKSGTTAVAPDAPSLTSVTAQNPAAGQSTGAIALSWQAVAGVGGYNVYRRTASGAYDYSSPLNGPTPVTGTSYTDAGSGLVRGTVYDYVVRGALSGSESANSNELATTAIGRLAPPASATATAIAGGQVRIGWAGVTGASGYNVYRRLATGAYDVSSPLNGATPVAGTTFVDTSAADATTYRYAVRSVVTGAGGTALESLTSSPETTAVTADASAPTGVSIANPGSPLRGAITLSGTASDAGSGVASVRMQIAPAGSGAWVDACTSTGSPYACSFASASTADGLYDLRAVATDTAGNTATSAVITGRRIDNSAPTVTIADPGAYLHGTVTLAATATDGGSGVASVTIQRAPTGTSAWTTVCTDTGTPYTCSLDTTALAAGGYDLRAVATDAAGNAATSATVVNRVVDNTAPRGVDVQTTNAAGGTSNHPETGDTITLSFSEPIAPSSILAGWTGAPTTVTLRFTNGNPDVISIWNAANTTQLALGSVTCSKKYVTSNVTFTGSTMALSGNDVTITLGTGSGTTQTASGQTSLTWTPSAAATDLAGNPLSVITVVQSGGSQQNF